MMSRENSAPAWVDPFADDVLRRLARIAQLDARGLQSRARGQEARAKSLGIALMPESTNPRGETPTKNQAPSALKRSESVIGDDIAAYPEAPQRGTIVQRRELTDMDRKVLAALHGLGGFATAKEIHARVTGASMFTVRSRLDRLASDGAVRNIPGRGYELRERG